MQRALLLAHACSRGLLRLSGECQQATRLHDVREEHEPGLISTKDFAHQDETQQGYIRLITMGAGLLHERSPLRKEASHEPGGV